MVIFLFHDQESVRNGGIAFSATAGVGAIATYLGVEVGSILDTLSSGGTEPAPIDVNAINMNLSHDLNSLSSSSTLAITNLNNTTTHILGYINSSTGFSTLSTLD